MKFTFKAKIYKVGINPCVKVPHSITDKMTPEKGYIRISGKIESYDFTQTLVPVKNEGYRLYVNGPMLKGGDVKVGDTAKFSIAQNFTRKTQAYKMPKEFKKELDDNGLYQAFQQLTAARQKDVLKYLSALKSEEALTRNIAKVIRQLKEKAAVVRVP
jgi:hypothetical protein